MFLGYYTPLFYSSVNPWTTLGPLAVVMSVSLAQEGYTDIRRHVSDKVTNNHPCVVLRRADEIDSNDRKNKKKGRKRDPNVNKGKDLEAKVDGTTRVPIAFESVNRMKIFTGDIVYVRNREMIPADLILLATSNDGGSAYIETSSIDGETNLKLRNSPHLPAQGLGTLAASSCDSLLDNDSGPESLKHAVQRVANMSLLGHTDGVGAVLNPKNADELPRRGSVQGVKGLRKGISQYLSRGSMMHDENQQAMKSLREGGVVSYVTTLTSEPPNTHVNNYSGKLTLPPNSAGSRSEHAPLGAENLLLRGAVLRNTEWIIGVACFTGADTKLVMNSVATPSKFSQLDMLINRTVLLVLGIMIASVCSLGALSTHLNRKKIGTLWYAGYSVDPSVPWPYFNLGGSSNLTPPAWKTSTPNFFQNTFMFVTMLSNFIPLSLYVSVEMITIMMMLYIGWDLNMYHEDTDTPASARSTIVTDLGLVQYIFSDKTGTLTCNIMEFKRCSVDGNVFGMPVSKAAPQGTIMSNEESKDAEFESSRPLKYLLAAGTSVESTENSDQYEREKLTFNAEMFLRVMSICHTVVVEKDQVPTDNDSPDASTEIKKTESNVSSFSSLSMLTPMKRAKAKAETQKMEKKDGSPEGFVYQAESPDEGALVSAASNEFGFQLLGRGSSGVQIACSCPSLLEDEHIVEGMKNGTLTAKILAGKTAANGIGGNDGMTVDVGFLPRKETWSILAVNKFDSDRKRMSVLVRSPPELGSVPMLFCKGADSSMMLDGVCEGVDLLDNPETSNVESESDIQNAEFSSLLGIGAHLGGEFVAKSV